MAFVAGVILAEHVLEPRVGEILVIDVLTLQGYLGAAISERQDAVGNEVGREGQWLCAVEGDGGLAVFKQHGDVLDTVLGVSGVHVPAEPVGGLPGSL